MAVTECVLRSTRSVNDFSAGRTIVAVYNITTDSKMAAPDVEDGARATTFTDPLPLLGDPFEESGSITSSFAFLAVRNIEVLNREDTPASALKWFARVIYRDRIPLNRRLGDPLTLAPEYSSEWFVVTEPRDRGSNTEQIVWPWTETEQFPGPTAQKPRVTPAIRKKDTFGPVTNAGGFRYGPISQKQILLPVYVQRLNVPAPYSFIPDHLAFQNKTNDKDWILFGLTGITLKKHTCRLLSISTLGPEYYGNDQQYWVRETKILYDPDRLHHIRQRNEGDKVWVQGEYEDAPVELWSVGVPVVDGLRLQPPIPLDRTGRQLEDGRERMDFVFFRDLEETDFNKLTSRLLQRI